jgi:hypothetical protein
VSAEQSEIERLRARVAALEAELADTEAWANRTVAEAQEKTYWLDRWHVDLDRLVNRPSVNWIRKTARGARSVVRIVRRLKRRPRS